MKAKNKYIIPRINVIELELEEIAAISNGKTDLKDAGGYHGQSNSRERTFWDF